MSSYSLQELIPWLLIMVANAYMYSVLRRAKTTALRALRKYLAIQCVISPIGFVLLWAFGDAAHYPSSIVALFADAGAQAILLYGVWKSFGKNTPITGPIAVVIAAFALSLGAWSAQRSAIEANLYQISTWPWMCINHAIGYGFCYVVALLAFMSCLKDLDWKPSAVRIMIGYAVYLASDFGIEQTQVLQHWHFGPWVNLIPTATYILSLAIWHSAISLDDEAPMSVEQAATIKRALADAVDLFQATPTSEEM